MHVGVSYDNYFIYLFPERGDRYMQAEQIAPVQAVFDFY